MIKDNHSTSITKISEKTKPIGLRELKFSHPTLEKKSERSFAALEGRHSSNGPCSDNEENDNDI